MTKQHDFSPELNAARLENLALRKCIADLLPMAEAWHKREFSCQCLSADDFRPCEEAVSIEVLQRAVELAKGEQ
jgi:hypothetical protein